jgi:hypothetical protein
MINYLSACSQRRQIRAGFFHLSILWLFDPYVTKLINGPIPIYPRPLLDAILTSRPPDSHLPRPEAGGGGEARAEVGRGEGKWQAGPQIQKARGLSLISVLRQLSWRARGAGDNYLYCDGSLEGRAALAVAAQLPTICIVTSTCLCKTFVHSHNQQKSLGRAGP